MFGFTPFLDISCQLAVRSIVMILKKIQARLNILFFSFFAFGFIFISFPHFTVAIPLLQYVQLIYMVYILIFKSTLPILNISLNCNAVMLLIKQ